MNANCLARQYDTSPGDNDNPCRCHDCGKIYPAMFMLKDEIWDSMVPFGQICQLCLSCAEKRLGRPIVFEDLRPCVISDQMLIGAYLTRRSDITFDDNFLETV